MNKKMTYEAPVTEQMEVRFEVNIMSTKSATSVESANYYDNEGWD